MCHLKLSCVSPSVSHPGPHLWKHCLTQYENKLIMLWYRGWIKIVVHMVALREQVQEGTAIKRKRTWTPERNRNEPSDYWEGNLRKSR